MSAEITVGESVNNEFSVAFWMFASNEADGPVISRLGEGGSFNSWVVSLFENELSFSSSSSHIVRSRVNLDTWVHVVCTYSSTREPRGMNLYIDGERRGEATLLGFQSVVEYSHTVHIISLPLRMLVLSLTRPRTAGSEGHTSWFESVSVHARS